MKLDFFPHEWDVFYEKCGFTDSEKEVIELRRRGWELPRIAAELYLSERTVNRRIKSVAGKIERII